MNKTLIISLTAVFSALYAVGVIILAPISYGEIQVRVIDCLIPLSGVFGLPVILGVTLGNIVANIFGGLGVLDILGGSIANLIASAAVFYILNLRETSSNQKLEILLVYSSALLATFIITLIVGFYLSAIFLLPIPVMMLSIFSGSFISITLIGGTITVILRRSASIKKIF